MRSCSRALVFVAATAAAALALAGCGDGGPSAPSPNPQPPTGPRLSAVAEAYLADALDLMEEHSIRRLEIDWPSFRETTLEEADGAETRADTYEAIHSAVERLGDGHSRFVEPDDAGSVSAIRMADLVPAVLTATGPDGARGGRLGTSVGYLAVPAFGESSDQAMTRLATDLQDVVREADGEGVCGWIVDLRGNTGGNMWPMLAGVGPILGEGDAGLFVDPEGVTETFFYRDGGAGLRGSDGEVVIATVEGAAHELAAAPSAIAVLTSAGTVSSGEAITIAFREHPAATSFGQPTGGLSTAVSGFPLDDGAVLALATAVMADRTGRQYGEEVDPDVTIEQAPSGDPVLEQAYAAVADAAPCDGPDALPRAEGDDLTGAWSGVGNMGGLLLLEMDLAEASTEVTGTATLSLGGVDESCEVAGARDGADLGLTISCPAGPLSFAGVATDGSTMVGVLRESLADVAFTFERP